MARTESQLTSSEIAIVESLEPIGTALQQIRVDAGATGLEYFTPSSASGDMLASTYDPTNIAGDAFARANHTGTQNFTTIVGNEITGNTTASNGGVYIVTANATFTDPSPSQGLGYKVIVRNGTATIGGTGYSVSGSEIIRLYHSGAWANYLKTPSSGVNTGDQTTIVGITGTLAQFNTACTDADFARTDAANTFTGTQTITQIDLGNTDTSITRVSAGQAGIEGVRIKTTTPLVVSATSYTTDTGTSLNMDNLDMFIVTAQAGALLFNAPGGTLVQGRQLIIRIKDNGTARALTWNSVFRAMGTTLPSTTVLSKTLYLGFIYSSTDTKWDLIASAQEA